MTVRNLGHDPRKDECTDMDLDTKDDSSTVQQMAYEYRDPTCPPNDLLPRDSGMYFSKVCMKIVFRTIYFQLKMLLSVVLLNPGSVRLRMMIPIQMKIGPLRSISNKNGLNKLINGNPLSWI